MCRKCRGCLTQRALNALNDLYFDTRGNWLPIIEWNDYNKRARKLQERLIRERSVWDNNGIRLNVGP